MKKKVGIAGMLLLAMSLASCGTETPTTEVEPLTGAGSTVVTEEVTDNVDAVDAVNEEAVKEATEMADDVANVEVTKEVIDDGVDKTEIIKEEIPTDVITDEVPEELFEANKKVDSETGLKETETADADVSAGEEKAFDEAIVDVAQDIDTIENTVIDADNVEYEPEQDLNDIMGELDNVK